MLFRFRNAQAIVVAAVALTGMSALAACDDGDPLSGKAEIQAELVAPPGVPEPIHRGPAHVIVDLSVEEKVVEIAPGVRYPIWTFNGSIPGPMIRVRQGDQVEIRLSNPAASLVVHNIDLHAVNGPGGGAGATNVAPGEAGGFFFAATAPGLYIYHCAAGIVADHIANGMYGAILVEPEAGLPEVDHEYYVGQSEFYPDGDRGDEGEFELDPEKLLAETPEYVVFNGHTQSLHDLGALTAETGETVRLYVVNGGPNLVSSFHVIGEIFDGAFELGSFAQPNPLPNVQTVLVPAGGAAVVEFKVDVPGDYRLVDHSLSRVSKGALGILTVIGEGDDEVFRPFDNAPADDGHGEATAEPTSEAPEGAVTVAMRDNVFAPDSLEVAAGEEVVLAVPNEGKVPHNLRIAGADGDYGAADSVVTDPEIVQPAGKGTLEWTAPSEPGEYEFRCDIHPVEMTGTITVN